MEVTEWRNGSIGAAGRSALGGSSLLAAFLCAIIVLTAVGNSLLILLILTQRSLRNTSNFFLVSLFAADLLVGLVVMPPAMLNQLCGRWVLERTLCSLWHSFDVMCCSASILNLCAISLDRYLLILRPLQYKLRMGPRRALGLILAVWGLAALASFLPITMDWHELETRAANATAPLGPTERPANASAPLGPTAWPANATAPLGPTERLDNASAPLGQTERPANASAPLGPTARPANASAPLGPMERPANTSAPLGPTAWLANASTPLRRTEWPANASVPLRPTEWPANASAPLGPTERPANTTALLGPMARPANASAPLGPTAWPVNGTALLGSTAWPVNASAPLGPTERPTNASAPRRPGEWATTKGGVPGPDQCRLLVSLPYALGASCLTFFLPSVAICFTYGRILLAARKQAVQVAALTANMAGCGSEEPEQEVVSMNVSLNVFSKSQKKEITFIVLRLQHSLVGGSDSRRLLSKHSRKALKASLTLGILLGMFFVTWLPFFIANMAQAVCDCVPESLFDVLTWLGYCNSTMNPIIYPLFMRDFKRAMARFLPCCRRSWENKPSAISLSIRNSNSAHRLGLSLKNVLALRGDTDSMDSASQANEHLLQPPGRDHPLDPLPITGADSVNLFDLEQTDQDLRLHQLNTPME